MKRVVFKLTVLTFIALSSKLDERIVLASFIRQNSTTPPRYLFRFRRGQTPSIFGNADFEGTVYEWMSGHHCFGLYPYNRSCFLRNIYFNNAGPYGRWTYVTSVPPNSSDKFINSYLSSLKSELQVDISSRLWSGSQWPVEFSVFTATPVSNIFSVPKRVHLSNTLSSTLSNVFVGINSSGCNFFWEGHTSCIVDGVQGFASRPFFVMERSNTANLGHSIWDDCIPFLQVIDDLRLEHKRSQFDLLLYPQTENWRSNLKSVFELFSFTSPRLNPVQALVLANVGDDVFFFPELVVGLSGMSAHNLRPTMTVYGSERRSVWKFRNYFLESIGHSREEIFRTAATLTLVSSRPQQRYRLLYVRSKRPLWNEAELLENITASFPLLKVDSMRWEDLSCLDSELQELMNTHIFMSGDGTVAVTTPFLPEGAVHIQLGVARPWGSQIQMDMLFSSLDHIRVLYYANLGPDEHLGDPSAGFKIPPHKLHPYIDEAVRLLQFGFTTPVPSITNKVPSARLLSFLLTKYPDFAGAINRDGGSWEDLKKFRYRDGLFQQCTIRLHKACPASFQRDINEFCDSYGCEP